MKKIFNKMKEKKLETVFEEYFVKIHRQLIAAMGKPEILHRSSPLAHCESALEILIATVLTQATSDQNALKAWLNLKTTYEDWSQVLDLGVDLLFQTIRPAGMAVQRSKVILKVLETVHEQFGEFSLDCLKTNPKKTWDFLNNLPGIGPKTAACTMLFGFGFSCFPVDTHIERIAKRMGWVKSNTRPGDIQAELVTRIPEKLLADLHILLLNLGRNYCRPQHPICSTCPLREECQFTVI